MSGEITDLVYVSRNVGGTFKSSKHQFIWEFTIDNKRVSVQFFDSKLTNKKKIVYNQRIIREEEDKKDIYTHSFIMDGHNYKVEENFGVADLQIDEESFEHLYQLQKNKQEFYEVANPTINNIESGSIFNTNIDENSRVQKLSDINFFKKQTEAKNSKPNVINFAFKEEKRNNGNDNLRNFKFSNPERNSNFQSEPKASYINKNNSNNSNNLLDLEEIYGNEKDRNNNQNWNNFSNNNNSNFINNYNNNSVDYNNNSQWNYNTENNNLRINQGFQNNFTNNHNNLNQNNFNKNYSSFTNSNGNNNMNNFSYPNDPQINFIQSNNIQLNQKSYNDFGENQRNNTNNYNFTNTQFNQNSINFNTNETNHYDPEQSYFFNNKLNE